MANVPVNKKTSQASYMSDNEDHPSLDGYPIDEDYVAASKQQMSPDDPERADLSYMSEDTDASDAEIVIAAETTASDDTSVVFSKDAGSAAATAIDEKIDDEAVISNDGRSHTRTMFYADEAPESRQYQYSRLAKYNDGMYASDRDTQNKKADNRRWVSAYAGLFDVTEHQAERTEACLQDIYLPHMAHYSAEQVILAVMHLVCWEDGRHLCSEPEFDRVLCETSIDMTGFDSLLNLTFRKSDMLHSEDFSTTYR
jgi:hypothetical protein